VPHASLTHYEKIGILRHGNDLTPIPTEHLRIAENRKIFPARDRPLPPALAHRARKEGGTLALIGGERRSSPSSAINSAPAQDSKLAGAPERYKRSGYWPAPIGLFGQHDRSKSRAASPGPAHQHIMRFDDLDDAARNPRGRQQELILAPPSTAKLSAYLADLTSKGAENNSAAL